MLHGHTCFPAPGRRGRLQLYHPRPGSMLTFRVPAGLQIPRKILDPPGPLVHLQCIIIVYVSLIEVGGGGGGGGGLEPCPGQDSLPLYNILKPCRRLRE